MRVRWLKNWNLSIHFDFSGFGYAHITGNSHQRKLYFIGFATVEAIDKREYPNIKDASFTRNVFGKEYDGKWIEF